MLASPIFLGEAHKRTLYVGTDHVFCHNRGFIVDGGRPDPMSASASGMEATNAAT